MLPDIICIGIILFFVCAMAVSSNDSTKLRFADRLGLLFGIKRNHNETCKELLTRVREYRSHIRKNPTGFESAMDRANEALKAFGTACGRATVSFGHVASTFDINRSGEKK